jgi:hypothetical protein
MSVDDLTKVDFDGAIVRVKDRTYRHDVSVAAYGSGKILLVKPTGYLGNNWRLPQGAVMDFLRPDVEIELKDASDDAKVVMKLLKALVGCMEVGEVRKTGNYHIDFEEDARELSDAQATGKVFHGKVIDMYLAEMLCEESRLVKGARIKDIRMVAPPDIDKYNLSIQEAVALKAVLKTYCIDY